MKFHIAYELKEGPWGGGNQFLKALKKYLDEKGFYVNQPKQADIIIFNSHHNLRKVVFLKCAYPEKIFIHRLDNLMQIARGSGNKTDSVIMQVNRKIADGTIFQSHWCRDRFVERGWQLGADTVIHNAPDPAIFYKQVCKDRGTRKKIRIVASSWSVNERKGFPLLKFLDEHLDFNRFEMTYIGPSPVSFRNITHRSSLPTHQLAAALRENDIYISGSYNEACSNSLLEAIHSGLIPLARDSGANSELINIKELLFSEDKEVPGKLEGIASDMENYEKQLKKKSFEETVLAYTEFAEKISRGKRKKISFISLLSLYLLFWTNEGMVK